MSDSHSFCLICSSWMFGLYVCRIFTLYSKSLPLDVACRVWDVFCRDGEEFLFRTGLGILRLYEEVLLCMDFILIAQFLTRLPDDVSVDRLFSCISCTQMTSSNRKWTQVCFSFCCDLLAASLCNLPMPLTKTWLLEGLGVQL